MLIKGNNGQSTARKRQPKSVSSSSKSTRSNTVSKGGVHSQHVAVADELDGDINSNEAATVESEAGDRVLEAAGIGEAARGNDLPGESVELTAITLHQPWASLIANGSKHYETRNWPTNYRGLIAIHAGRKPKGKQELRDHGKVVASFGDLLTEDCPYSSVIAIAQLIDCILMTEEFINQQSPTEVRCGNWQVGRYAFKLENVRAIEPIQAAGKQGLWKFDQEAAGFNSLEIYPLEPWNPADFGEAEYKSEADGQLNFLEVVEPPEPDDYESIELFDAAYKQWKSSQQSTVNSQQSTVNSEGLCNTLMDGSTFAAESVQDSPMLELNCGEDSPTNSAKETATAATFSSLDIPQKTESLQTCTTSTTTEKQTSLQPHLPVSHLLKMENDAEPVTQETVSPQSLQQSEATNQNSQLLKMLPDFSTVQSDQEVTSSILLEPLTNFPKAGTMSNGKLSAAHTLEAPGVEKGSLLLRSPGALSTGNGRPPGQCKLESQLRQLVLIQDGEVAAPEFLEAGYQLPIGFTNLQESRTALELSQVQPQQSSIDPKSELPAVTQTTAIEEKPSEMPLTGELLLLDSSELNICLTLPPNIGALTKAELISMAEEQHQLICLIERKEFELAIEKLHRVRLTGVYLQEFKKKCQYGEFENQLEQAGIGVRSAQNYMIIAKKWEIVEAKTKLVALLAEENQPAIGLKWALETIRDEKKELKSAAPPKDPDSWRTPNTKEQPIVDLVKQALGGNIWLDPCSDSSAKVPASVRYFKADNGLAEHQTWSKTVFINPPFSDPSPWVEKCCLSIARGNVSAAVMLLKAGVVSNVGTGELINKYGSALCYWRGRINFLNDEGNAVKGSDFDCVFVYFGARLDLFREAFGGRGTIATIENHYSSVNKKHLLKNEIPDFGNVEAEQKQLAAAVGLGNGRSVLPDRRDFDRELAERYDPHTVVDVMSMPTISTIPVPPISENLFQSLAEPEIFDETPLLTRQFETAKQNTLNDYITAISSNLSDFSNEQIAFLAKIINEESTKRIGF